MPGLYAVGSPIPPTPPARSLKVSATEVTDGIRWEQGFTICPENCVEASTWDPDCEAWPIGDGDGPDGRKTAKSDPADNLACYDVDPFVIETSFECSSAGFQTQDYAGRARRQLEAATPKAMEYELWTGALKSSNPNLVTGATVIGDGLTGYSPKLALSLLGQALANCAHGSLGFIHAPTWIVDLWADGSMVEKSGKTLVTSVRGDVVVAGSGYTGSGPAGSSELGDHECWVYATGPVQYRLGEAMVFPETQTEALDRKHNRIEYRAERFAAVWFDPCCHFGIRVQASEPE